ncbi:hypothetical protein OG985_43890 [Streptomyces sp. NBC_00289]|uniref:hypothetical protein n=1 Tax=Streptomyces sp. NBC_00289 TaxID=2975703 RepID=UPI00324C8262
MSSDGTLTGNSADGAAQMLIDLPVASSTAAELSDSALVITPAPRWEEGEPAGRL